jgi:hypothetical protein
MANKTKTTLEATSLDVIADRGYFSSEQILACDKAGITVTLPKPMTSNAKAEGRFGKQDFRYVTEEDVYVCPPERTSPTTTPMRRMDWLYADTGPTPVKAALSNIAAVNSATRRLIARRRPPPQGERTERTTAT